MVGEGSSHPTGPVRKVTLLGLTQQYQDLSDLFLCSFPFMGLHTLGPWTAKWPFPSSKWGASTACLPTRLPTTPALRGEGLSSHSGK